MSERAVGARLGRRRRVLIDDSRHNGTYLRTTWHPEGRTFVVSVWNDDVCTAAVRVPAEQSAELVSLLVDGLAEAATTPVPVPGTAEPGSPSSATQSSPLTNARDQLNAWARRAKTLARQIVTKPAPPASAAPAAPKPQAPPAPKRHTA